MENLEQIGYLLLYPVTDDRMYHILSNKKQPFYIMSWILKEGAKKDSSIPKEKMSEIHLRLLELQTIGYAKSHFVKGGGWTLKPTWKWRWHYMVTHKTVGFWGLIATFIFGGLSIAIPVIVSNQPVERSDTKVVNPIRIDSPKSIKPSFDSFHTKKPILPNNVTLKK